MSAYTPGEWKFGKDEAFVYALNNRGNNRFFVSVQPGWMDDNSRTPQGELLANARLIAAAPELLDALQAILKSYTDLVDSGDCGNWDSSTEDCVISARAAIARATGDKA